MDSTYLLCGPLIGVGLGVALGLAITWGQLRRGRFSLLELLAAVVGFAGVLACMHFLILKKNWDPAEVIPLAAMGTGFLMVFGFWQGCSNRNQIREEANRVRWIVFLAGLLAPATTLPALLVGVSLCLDDLHFCNDFSVAIVWLLLLMPGLCQAWFSAISSVRKDDQAEAQRLSP